MWHADLSVDRSVGINQREISELFQLQVRPRSLCA
jgi:hypothetical protein